MLGGCCGNGRGEGDRRIIRSVEIGRCGICGMRQNGCSGRNNGFESVIKRGSVCI
jgi:hypothetical protein